MRVLVVSMFLLAYAYFTKVVLAFLFIYSIRRNHCKAPQNNYLDGALYKKKKLLNIIIIIKKKLCTVTVVREVALMTKHDWYYEVLPPILSRNMFQIFVFFTEYIQYVVVSVSSSHI